GAKRDRIGGMLHGRRSDHDKRERCQAHTRQRHRQRDGDGAHAPPGGLSVMWYASFSVSLTAVMPDEVLQRAAMRLSVNTPVWGRRAISANCCRAIATTSPGATRLRIVTIRSIRC